MAQLIHLRQRIKSITTIKKITHAMRLIAMSTHAQLKHQAPFVAAHTKAMTELYAQVYANVADNSTLANPKNKRMLTILIGSQKGLCGNFNVNLFHFFKEHTPTNNTDLIVVGKKMLDYVYHQQHPIMQNYANLSVRSLSFMAQSLTQIILDHVSDYGEINVMSMSPKTFFLQQPIKTTVLPREISHESKNNLTEYHWQQDKQEVLSILLQQYIHAVIYQALFESLFAEQAARFISMDSSTRNAKELLEKAQLQYNKLRQMTITKELTELSSSY